MFFHDFIVTKNYYIFNKAPIKFDPLPFLLGMKGPAECIQFDNTSPATIILVPRDGTHSLTHSRTYSLTHSPTYLLTHLGTSPVEEVKVDSHFNFHFSNAYEDENGEVIFDVVWCDNMQLGYSLTHSLTCLLTHSLTHSLRCQREEGEADLVCY